MFGIILNMIQLPVTMRPMAKAVVMPPPDGRGSGDLRCLSVG